MSRLGFKVSSGGSARAEARRTRRPLAALAAAGTLCAVGGGALLVGASGQGVSIAARPVLDGLAVGSIHTPEVGASQASWNRDFERCAQRLTQGGHYSKSSGIERVRFGGPHTVRDRLMIEPRMVSCLAAGRPAKFCDPDYRRNFVEFSRSIIRRVSAGGRIVHRANGRSYEVDPAPLVRGALERVLRTGAVRPVHYREVRDWGAVPSLVAEVAAGVKKPTHLCGSAWEVWTKTLR